MRMLCLPICAILVNAALAGESPPPAFVAKPVATKAVDGTVKIEFAVDRETGPSMPATTREDLCRPPCANIDRGEFVKGAVLCDHSR